jgi:hypothetical protein
VILNVGDINFQNTPWIPLPLAGGAQAYSTANTPEYCKRGGVVYIQGALKNITTVGTVFANLPVGYRPSKGVAFACVTSGKEYAQWVIETTGTVKLDDVSQTALPAAGDWFPITVSFVAGG